MPMLRSGEGQVGLNSGLVGLINPSHLTQLPFALGVLGRHQMALGRLRTQDFATRGNFEPLSDCLASFAARNGLRHRARKIAGALVMTTGFSVWRSGQLNNSGGCSQQRAGMTKHE